MTRDATQSCAKRRADATRNAARAHTEPRARSLTVKGVKSARFKRGGKTITAPLTAAGDRVRVQSPNWYGRINGKEIKLFRDAVASQQRLAELLRKSEFESVGIVDHFTEHRTRPLLEHLDDFKDFLKSLGNTPASRQTTKRSNNRACNCALKAASAVVDWLAINGCGNCTTTVTTI